jgi:two-component system NtrC family sensor kinase
MLELIGCSVEQTLAEILERLDDGSLDGRLHVPRKAPSDVEVGVTDDRTWNLTLAPLHGDPRRPEGVVLVLADVTERRRIQQQLAQSEKMSSLGQMISGVAHELNNPLASILGYAQLLRLRGGDEAQKDKLDTLAREAERCRKIVQNLLSFGRRREPERKPLSLNQVVENVLALMRYQLRVDDVTIEHELGRDLPVVRGDAHQLEQALVNLLTNSRHAIGGTGAPGKVVVRTRVSDGGEVILEVEDDGPGVPRAQRSKIFDPFFTTKQDGKGTGLGLALVYGILSDHGGRIELRPGTLGGARFVATFPLCGAEQAIDTPAEAPLPSPARTGRILIVDDEEPLALMIAEVLAADGHETRVVLDGRQALERLAEEPYDLIISDLKMPGMNGDQLYAEVRRLRPELSVSVLLTTGDTFEDDAQAILDRTGLEVLSKPFDLDDLRRRVRSRLSERKPDA